MYYFDLNHLSISELKELKKSISKNINIKEKRKEKIKSETQKLIWDLEWKKVHPEHQIEWSKYNADHFKEYQNHLKKKRYKNDKLYREKIKMRYALNKCIRTGVYPKNSKISKFYGCGVNMLKNYLESKFNDNMHWGNYGEYWEIDHIIPLHSANNLEELVYLNHYTNLQPLTKEENISKSGIFTESDKEKFLNNFNKSDYEKFVKEFLPPVKRNIYGGIGEIRSVAPITYYEWLKYNPGQSYQDFRKQHPKI